MSEMIVPELSHEQDAKAEMVEAVATYLQEGYDTITEGDLARRGFTDREIADYGKDAINAGHALYNRRREAGSGQVLSYLPISRLRRHG